MNSVKSRARKQNTGLTVTQATSQARRHVDAIMPGVQVFVDSRLSADVHTLAPIVITTVSFPVGSQMAHLLSLALEKLTGVRQVEILPEQIIVIRAQ